MPDFKCLLFFQLLSIFPQAIAFGETNSQLSSSSTVSAKVCDVPYWQLTISKPQLALLRKKAVLEKEQQELMIRLKAEIKALNALNGTSDLSETTPPIAELDQPSSIRPHCSMLQDVTRAYVQEVVARIERCGTDHFPIENGKKIYGSRNVEFMINRSGALVDVVVMAPSKNDFLELHLTKLLKTSSPFGLVPNELHDSQFERMKFSVGFQFVKDDSGNSVATPKRRCTFR